MKIRFVILLFLLILSSHFFAQKVGVVLSGGGASGIAHVGFLKALEENNIPIDYIAGTSMGALIGGLYAAGYSPEEIEQLTTNEKYIRMARGKLEDKYIYYFKQKEVDASWVTIKLSKNNIIETSLPTNLVSSIELDFEMMTQLSGAAATANYNFDSLFVPFRCTASDVASQKSVVFKNGYLNQAIRASMSYPFYLKPIKVEGKLLFDGGLYNNFPSDVIYKDFFPDIILGSNVAGNPEPPDEDNLVSQLKSMMMHQTNFSAICENGIIIEPNDDGIGTFDFQKAPRAVQEGYKATIARIDEIKKAIERRVPKEEVEKRRQQFRKRQTTMNFDKINVTGVKTRQEKYIRRSLKKKKKPLTQNLLKRNYFKLYSDDKVKHLYPTARFNTETNLYDLNVDVRSEKDIIIDFGGNFASRPINTAYIAAKYNYFGGDMGVSLMANTYFGKLYASTQVKTRVDFPITIPFYIEPEFTMNRWDYFKSRTWFFDDNKPSFFVQRENYGGVNIGLSVKNKGKIKAGVTYAELLDEYYQTQYFTKNDTADKTYFDVISPYILYERNTLNQKQYANQGSHLLLSARYIDGEEINVPGSTSQIDLPLQSNLHDWYQFKIKYDTYYINKGILRLGILAEGVYSNQPFFNNYTASILRAPAFQPNPESKTLFLESFRAYQYVAIGHKILINIREDLDLRIEGYLFQPYQRLLRQADESVKYGEPFAQRYTIAMAAAVYNSPVGPISLSVNYYHNVPEVAREDTTPITVLFHFGYIIFNRRALE